MALYGCVDCGQGLSSTAKICSKCSSTDPFGRQRAADRFKAGVALVIAAVIGSLVLSMHFNVINPEMIKQFLRH